MSFSKEVREELSNKRPKSKKGQAEEMAARELFAGKLDFTQDGKKLNIIDEKESGTDILELTQNPQKKRAFLRGAFISAGSINDPEKGYHLEIVCDAKRLSEFLKDLIESFGITGHITERSGRWVVYMNDGDDISDFLKCIEAPASLMKFENVRIIREMRGTVNRKVNCETANINKSVQAAGRQIADIELIKKTIGLEKLDENLREICRVRWENPDVSLEELGRLLSPPLGKSGVNHRLRKISNIAEKIRRDEANDQKEY